MKSEFKKIAIICASERELAPFLPLIENPTISERAMLRIHEGRLNGFEVAAVYCGVCKVNAAAAAQIMIDCYGADTVISAGASGGMAEELQLFDTVVAAEACYHDVHERILTDYHPFMKTQFFPASSELVSAAKALKMPYHTGVVQCKDAFYGQHAPELMPVSYELQNKWEAWKKLGCLASEMETAALYIVAAKLHVRVGACFLVMANQEREKLGLENPVVHDTDMAVQVAVEAIRKLIKEDR